MHAEHMTHNFVFMNQDSIPEEVVVVVVVVVVLAVVVVVVVATATATAVEVAEAAGVICCLPGWRGILECYAHIQQSHSCFWQSCRPSLLTSTLKGQVQRVTISATPLPA